MKNSNEIGAGGSYESLQLVALISVPPRLK
jgi:hypothetical protein